MQAAVNIASKHNIPVILNPAPAIRLPSDLVEMVDYLTPNESEAAILAGDNSYENAINGAFLLKSKLKIKNLIITLGEKGAMVVGNPNLIVSAYSVNSIDSTGAGDAFNGAMAVALARGDALADAVKFANAIAALTTTHSGAQSSLPKMEVVETFLKENQIG